MRSRLRRHRVAKCGRACRELIDGLVVEVEAAYADGQYVLGEEKPDAALGGRDGGGVVAEARPALAEDRVRGLRRGAAHREAEPEEVAQRGRDDVGCGLLGGGDDDDAGGAAAGDEIAQ